VIPALEQHGARILGDCLVVKLEVKGRAVQSALCIWNGRQVMIRGRVFVLGLNALLTPALLLRSANEAFPDGLGNSSGMVGRNLMWHVSDYLSVRFKALRGPLNELLQHGISLNDFYVSDGVKLGNIHAHVGRVLNADDAVPTATDAAGTAAFATIVEDFPYLDNRVTPMAGSDSGVLWEYHHRDELRSRSQMLISAFADALKSTCEVSAREPSGRLNPGHMCGTCRFGNNSRTSVLDRDNRLHDLDNAYVVDASFFPSSGGINPALTIMANSLRVSAAIARR
jgi:choline dehydrogenase-like flavoprotein